MGKRFLKASVSVFRSGKGFTLIEVMVAMSILLVGMLGIAAMFSYSNNAFGRARYINTATGLAYDRVSEIKIMESWSGCADTPVIKNTFSSSTTLNGLTYFYHYSTSQIGNLQAAKVKVIVRWAMTQQKQKSNHVISLTTITTGRTLN